MGGDTRLAVTGLPQEVTQLPQSRAILHQCILSELCREGQEVTIIPARDKATACSVVPSTRSYLSTPPLCNSV